MQKNWMFTGLLSMGVFSLLTACSSGGNKPAENTYHSASEKRPLVDEKYSLSSDRKAMDDLRSQIPPEKKHENDESAFMLSLTAEVKRPPSDIREKFDNLLHKKRDLLDKDLTKERDQFTTDERKKREAFLKSQQDARDQYGHEAHGRDEKNEFYKELDAKRSEYFSVERDRHSDFESDIRERRKNFEDYAREKTNDFNQDMREYTKRYDEMKKQKEEAAKAKQAPQSNLPSNSQPGYVRPDTSGLSNAEADALDREMQEAAGKPATPLGSGGE